MQAQSLQESQGAILVVVAVIIVVIVLIGASKNKEKGCGWIVFLAIAGLIAYLLISSEILK